ncbi:MAG: hypothetical protein JWO36_5277 [Myxococcales bacterium]|nr:hypothetical protein [Myxococcales bacterium]
MLFWALGAAALGALGCWFGLLVSVACESANSETVSMLGAIAPLPGAFLPMIGVAFLLFRLPVNVTIGRDWPVHSSKSGTGRLVISPDALYLAWKDRGDLIQRSSVKSAVVDGECLRLVWTEGELVLMPLMQPQTRDGRIRQSQTLARMLAPTAAP